jgi:hypothetical protein
MDGSIFFTEKKKNIIIDGIFTKILYSTPHFTMTGVYIRFCICSKLTANSVSSNEFTEKGFRGFGRVADVSGWRQEIQSGTPIEDSAAKIIHKTYVTFNPTIEPNHSQIESICEFESRILSLYSNFVRSPTAEQDRHISAAVAQQSVGLQGNSVERSSNEFTKKPTNDVTVTSESTIPIIPMKTPVYCLRNQLYGGCIRAHTENGVQSQSVSTELYTKYIKISGVWETDQTYGITYKVIYA